MIVINNKTVISSKVILYRIEHFQDERYNGGSIQIYFEGGTTEYQEYCFDFVNVENTKDITGIYGSTDKEQYFNNIKELNELN